MYLLQHLELMKVLTQMWRIFQKLVQQIREPLLQKLLILENISPHHTMSTLILKQGHWICGLVHHIGKSNLLSKLVSKEYIFCYIYRIHSFFLLWQIVHLLIYEVCVCVFQCQSTALLRTSGSALGK